MASTIGEIQKHGSVKDLLNNYIMGLLNSQPFLLILFDRYMLYILCCVAPLLPLDTGPQLAFGNHL